MVFVIYFINSQNENEKKIYIVKWIFNWININKWHEHDNLKNEGNKGEEIDSIHILRK